MGSTEKLGSAVMVRPGRYAGVLATLALGLTLALVLGWHVLPWLRPMWAPSGAEGAIDGMALLVAPLLAFTAFGVGWRARGTIATTRRPWRLALVCTLAGSYAFALAVLAVGSLAVIVQGPEDRLLALAVLGFSWAFAVPYGLLGWAVFLPLALPLTAGALAVLRRTAGGIGPLARTAGRPPSHAAAAGTA